MGRSFLPSRLYAVTLGVASVACGGGVAAPPAISGTSSSMKPDPERPVLEPGERLVARAELLGLSVGRLEVSVRESCDPTLHDRWTAEATLSTEGLARLFKSSSGEARVVLDRETLLPVAARTVVNDGSRVRRYELRFEGDHYRFVLERSPGEVQQGKRSLPRGVAAHDVQTALLLLRSWRPEPGEEGYLHVVMGRHLWRADVTHRGKQWLEHRSRRERVVRLEGEVHRVDLRPGEKYEPRKFSLWLTDDDRRVPLKASGDGSIGAVHLELEERAVDAACTSVSSTAVAGAAVSRR